MASFWSRVSTATAAAWAAWRRTYEDPESVQGGSFQQRSLHYRMLWEYYTNESFEDLNKWASYKRTYSLYRSTRSLFNPTRRLVDFYAAAVYPGVLSEDGSKLPEGVPLAIPLAADTPTSLTAAIAQFWQWTNWQAGKAVFVRYGAAAGSVLVEVIDDLDRRKVTANIVWPGLVKDLTLDATGNVKAYTVEYVTADTAGPYTFTKVVDADQIQTFRDGRLWAPDGLEAAVPNPYGFVPAVWAKHRDLGGDHGAPAIAGSMGKIDEVNSLASHIHDQVHKVVAAPLGIFGSGSITPLFGQTKRGPTDEFTDPESDREKVLMIGGPADTHVETLAGNLDIEKAMITVDKLLAEVEQDNPELGMYRELRAMTQVTGPGAGRIMGDVGGRVWESAANYDQQSIKLFQMAVAIAGWRIQTGAWGGTLTRQQEKFRAFNLDSYQRGDLDFDIAVRPLIPVLPEEQMSLERQKLSLENDRAVLQQGDQPAIAARLVAAAGQPASQAP